MNAQNLNLVPNASFSYYAECPKNQGDIHLAYPWFAGFKYRLGGSSELYHECNNTDNGFFGIPKNFLGYQIDNSNPKGYAGIVVAYKDFETLDFHKEFIEVGLSDSLIKGKSYCVSFYISTAEHSCYGVGKIQAYFTNDSFFVNNHNIEYPAQISSKQPILYDTLNWVQVTDTFRAKGGERFMTIGNFQKKANIIYQYMLPPLPMLRDYIAYYYIDDVSVYLCDDDTLTPPVLAPIIPDVFTPGGDGINDVFEIQHLPPMAALTIHNRWGQVIYQTTNYKNNWAADNTPAGVYYYTLTYTLNAEQKRQQGTVKIIK
jgi:gliding motility-associated-like protein